MPKIAKRLTDKVIDNARPKDKDYRLYDGEGLSLLVRKSGAKVWQYLYKFNGKTTIFTIGKYLKDGVAGHVSLQSARATRYEVRALLNEGIDPNDHKKNAQGHGDKGYTFEFIGREWHHKGTWAKKHAKNILRSLEGDVFPSIGNRQINDITRRDIVLILERIESREAYDVAKRVCQRCEAIFDYALAKGLCDDNPASGRAKYLKSPQRQNRPFLKEHQVGEFLYKLDNYHGKDYIRLGMKLLVFVFIRPGELREATWEEIDWKLALWRIPASRMKMNRDHVVPLSRQALKILNDIHELTGHSDFLFPSIRSAHKPISDVTFLKLIKILGYVGDKKIVPHGFRHTASTILNEHRFDKDIIERQLAHRDKNSVRNVYNHAEYLSERIQMMQWYSDCLDKLKDQYVFGDRL